MIIAFAYGYFRHGPSFGEYLATRSGQMSLAWYVLLIPFGEEFLFRGWIYQIGERFFRDRPGFLTTPFPASVWLSALAFSLWHLQNLSQDGAGMVAFQMGYTFFVGLWLGYLRWQSSGLFIPGCAHIALNLATVLG